jgi:universal stress protein E
MVRGNFVRLEEELRFVRSIRRILVAIKKPDAKMLPALDKAVQLARAFRAEIELFHAIVTPLYTGRIGRGVGLENQVAATYRMKVKQRLETLASAPRKQRLHVTTHAGWDFPAAEAIVRRARRIDADLIVAECHPGEHRGGWLLKLTDWELVRLSAVPLLLVKSTRQYRHPVVLAAVDPSHAYAKPAALDDQILRCARSVQRALRGSLHVVHAHEPMPLESQRLLRLDPEIRQTLQENARSRALARLKPLLKKAKVPQTRRHVVAADALSGIATVARVVDSSIVVMGAISRSGLKRVFIGNTAEQILDALRCDVLVVKAPDFVSPVAAPRRQ